MHLFVYGRIFASEIYDYVIFLSASTFISILWITVSEKDPINELFQGYYASGIVS